MRIRTISILVLIIMIVTSSPSQTDQAKELAEADDLSAQVAKLYEQKQFAQAIPIAQKVIAIRKARLKPSDPAITSALINLGELYLATKREAEAETVFREALTISESTDNPQLLTSSRLLDALAYIRVRKHDYAAAEPLLLRSLQIQETQQGRTDPRTVEAMKDFACLELKNVPMDSAKSKDNSQLSEEEIAKRSIKMRADCWLYGFDQDCDQQTYKHRSDAPKVLNGRAVRLITPPYPAAARNQRFSGKAYVAVRIDEAGNVSEARSVCGGYAELNAVSVVAARASTFTPTSINGKPTHVNGIIVYNFVAQ